MSNETSSDVNDKSSPSSDMNRSIELSIKSLEQQVRIVSVPRNASVLDLKHKIEVLFDIDSLRQRLIFQGKVLKDDKNLTDYENLDDGKVIHLVIRPLNAPHNPENDEPQQQQQRNSRRAGGRRAISSGYAVITLDASLADLSGATTGSLLPSLFSNLSSASSPLQNSPFSPSGRTTSPRPSFFQILRSNSNTDRSRRNRAGLDGLIDMMENADRTSSLSSLSTRLARTLAYIREINNLLDTPLSEFEDNNNNSMASGLRPSLTVIHESRQLITQHPDLSSQIAFVFDYTASLFERLGPYFRDLSQQLSNADEMVNYNTCIQL
ncbi:MAG: hypothetical protein EXX96DRAFT_203295 [Benjaminiella poitrasii]|nr:MAG: hypothetical protein EXX96DRAFT_203295 [Benjaminiella poitrasii]